MSFPSPRSSSPDHLSVHLDLFICICSTWISPCLHLVSLSVPERQLAGFILCTYFSPSAHPTLPLCMCRITSLSWPELDASGLSISAPLPVFITPPACSLPPWLQLRAARLHRASSSSCSCSSSHSEDSASPAAGPSTVGWKTLQLSKCASGFLPRFKYSNKFPQHATFQPIFYGFFIILHE